MTSVNKVIVRSDLRESYENFMRHVFEIGNGFPTHAGGAAALNHAPTTGLTAAEAEAADCSGGEGAPTAAAPDDDDDGGDSDGEPARSRPQLHKTPSLPALLAFASLSHYVSLGRSRIYGLIADGEFPKPIKIGKSSRWVRAEIDTWISHQSQQRAEV